MSLSAGEEESAGVLGRVSTDSGAQGTDSLSGGCSRGGEDKHWTLRG